MAGTFRDYVDEIARREGIAPESLNAIAPYLICREVGHLNMPRFFVGRFRSRPWRCTRCKTWWIAVGYGAADMTFWGWVIIDSPMVRTYDLDEIKRMMDEEK